MGSEGRGQERIKAGIRNRNRDRDLHEIAAHLIPNRQVRLVRMGIAVHRDRDRSAVEGGGSLDNRLLNCGGHGCGIVGWQLVLERSDQGGNGISGRFWLPIVLDEHAKIVTLIGGEALPSVLTWVRQIWCINLKSRATRSFHGQQKTNARPIDP